MDMSQDQTAASAAYWAERWRGGRTSWDLGGPHPRLGELIHEASELDLLPAGSRVLEPGCGRAHGGAALARQGYSVTAFDVVEEAIAEARKLYGDVPGLSFAVQDALTPVAAWRGQFRAVVDRAFLCALPKDKRRAYIDACFAHLAPGGVFLSIPFTEVRREPEAGPPFALPMIELTSLMAPGFSLVRAEERRVDGDGIIARETLCIFRRRDRMLVES